MIDDTESNILMAEATSTIAFRNLVIHGLSHIILLIAVCCVLPRCESRVIHRQEFLKTIDFAYSDTLICWVISSKVCCCCIKNDPSAGSPTDTVVRLLHPLDDKAHDTSPRSAIRSISNCKGPCNLPDHPIG